MAAPYPTCYLDGELLPLAEARISPLDRGFLFADGVYEVIPVHRGRPFRLRAHLERLDRSLAAIRLRNPHTMDEWAGIAARVAGAAGGTEMLVYLQVTRGAEFGRNHLFPREASPTVFAFASPYPSPDARVLESGLAAATLEDIRWDRCDIKSVALLANVLLRQEAADRGADEALLVRDGLLLEGSSSSVFLCVGGTLVTPPNDHRILPGTSRDAVLELAEGWLPCQVCPLEAREIESCDELWVASAGRGVLPVTRVDGAPVGTGQPGPLWREMYGRLQRHLDDIASTPALLAMAEDTLFEFPTDFPIKIMGAATDEFRSLAIGIVTRHFGDLEPHRIEERPSSGGKYLGLTITVRAESKAQLDAVYNELTSCRQVLVAL